MHGTDLFLDPSGAKSQFDGYAPNAGFRQAVRRAVHRYLYVIANYSAAMNGFSSASKIVPVTPWWQALINGLQFGFLALGVLSAAMLILCQARGYRKERKVRG